MAFVPTDGGLVLVGTEVSGAPCGYSDEHSQDDQLRRGELNNCITVIGGPPEEEDNSS